MKINTFSRLVLAAVASALTFSCGGSKEDQALERVAEDMGMDKKDLKNKSYYSFTVTGGSLDGQTFSTPAYAMARTFSTRNENNELTKSKISFIDPPQGDSNFNLLWEGDRPKPLTQSADSFGDSYVELKVVKEEVRHSFLSLNGSVKFKSKEKKMRQDVIMKTEYPVWDIEADFEGEFKEQNSGELVKIKGTFKGINPEE
jgi:hypothetical protein